MTTEMLSKEQWLEAAENIMELSEPIAEWLRKINCDGLGCQDADGFLSCMEMAYAAMNYVAEFAADKCMFLIVEEAQS